jgi:alpha-glucosidase
MSIDQEPFALGPVVLEASKKNIKLRYSILKFYYRHFINKRGLGTIFKPLWIDFPQDINTFNDSIA